MKKHGYVWLTLAAVLALLIDLYAFAGLRRVPDVGRVLQVQARVQAPLTDTYMAAGSFILRHTPFMQSFADDLAASAWGEAYGPIRANPAIALDQLDRASHGFMHTLMTTLYWAPLPLLLLALIGWLRRPRKVSLIRNGR